MTLGEDIYLVQIWIS